MEWRDTLQPALSSPAPDAPSLSVLNHVAAKPTGIELKPASNRPLEASHSSAAERATVKLRSLSGYAAENNHTGVATAVQAVPIPYSVQPLVNERSGQTTVKNGTEAASVLAQRLQEELTSSLAEALYLSAADIDPDKPFIEMGLDSIIGVEWMRTINRRYGTTVPATKVYDYPNVRALAFYLANQLQQVETSLLLTPTIAEHKTIAEGQRFSPPVSAISVPDFPIESRQIDSLLQQLTITLAEALYLTTDKVDPEAKFIDLGLDSIVGVEWLRAVNRQYGTTITATKLYDYPTLREFAAHLSSRMVDSDDSQPSVDHVLQQVQAGKLDIQQAEKLLITLGGVV
nr:acyl carrier protein [Paenibacillus agilis]